MLQVYLDFGNFYRQYIHRLADKLVPLQSFLRKDVLFNFTQQHKDTIPENNKFFLNSSTLRMKFLLPEKQ